MRGSCASTRTIGALLVLEHATKNLYTMLRWVVVFIVLALIAGFFGFTGISSSAASIAKVLFFIFLILLVLSLIFGDRIWKKLP